VATRLQQEVNQPRMLAALTAVVGTIAIVLCVIGLYGLTAAVVRQRLREMGIRVVLGANSRDLLRLLMRDSLTPVATGLVIGAGMALLAGRLIAAAMFFGVPPHDPWAFAAASASVLTAAIVAVTAPTRRAARVNPASVLRQT
jgi:ABC-type antimicrobial peptide transport system permease subunit